MYNTVVALLELLVQLKTVKLDLQGKLYKVNQPLPWASLLNFR